MRLGRSGGNQAVCDLCGDQFKGKAAGDADRKLLEHLKAIHSRMMVSVEELKRRGKDMGKAYHGVRWANEL